MAWVVIPNSDIDPDSAVTTGLITGLRDNVAAAFAGDSGAPRALGRAMAWDAALLDDITMAAAADYTLEEGANLGTNIEGTLVVTGTPSVACRTMDMTSCTGAATFNASHKVDGGFVSYLEVRLNAVQQQEWSTSSSTPQARTRNITFVVDDVIDWRLRNNVGGAVSTFSSPSETADEKHTNFYALDIASIDPSL